MRHLHALLPLLAASLPLLGACTSSAPLPPPVEEAELADTRLVHTVDELWLTSQPSPAALEAARDRGVRTVVNMRHEHETPDAHPRVLVEGLGMTYVPLPWNGPDELTDRVFDRARELFERVERPALVYCASSNRVGAVFVPWRALDGGIALDRALEEGRAIGLRTPAYEERIAEYVTERAAR
jgi:uncharacterized protein (TIGR01244 family)